MALGNTFSTRTISVGKAERVWREIRHRYPSGGTLTSYSAFSSAGIVPAGTPVVFDSVNKTITPVADSAISAAEDVNTLGINGYLQEDAPLTDGNGNAVTKVTGTVIYAGELYSYMYDSAVLAKLKTLTSVPQVVFVD